MEGIATGWFQAMEILNCAYILYPIFYILYFIFNISYILYYILFLIFYPLLFLPAQILVAEAYACAMQIDAHLILGEGELEGDVAVGEPFDVAQADEVVLRWRQLPYELAEEAEALVQLEGVGRRGG